MRFERLLRGGLAFGVGLGLLVAAPALAGAAPLTLQGAITYALANAPSIKTQQAAQSRGYGVDTRNSTCSTS